MLSLNFNKELWFGFYYTFASHVLLGFLIFHPILMVIGVNVCYLRFNLFPCFFKFLPEIGWLETFFNIFFNVDSILWFLIIISELDLEGPRRVLLLTLSQVLNTEHTVYTLCTQAGWPIHILKSNLYKNIEKGQKGNKAMMITDALGCWGYRFPFLCFSNFLYWYLYCFYDYNCLDELYFKSN